jgi:uncharacterized membrane protein
METPGFARLLVLFTLYSFVGWIIESSYRTLCERRGFINSGFLNGPFVPIYGFGALCVVGLDGVMTGLAFPVRILVFTIVCTAFEYAVGWLYETVFEIRLWDYSKMRFNLHGRICLLNTILWAVLITVFVTLIHPFVDTVARRFIYGTPIRYAAWALVGWMIVDAVFSTLELKSTADFITHIKAKLPSFEAESLKGAIQSMSSRYLRQFPNLREIASEALQVLVVEELMAEESGSSLFKTIRLILNPPAEPADMDPDYVAAVADLLADERVRSMANLGHHDDSVLHHSLTVSQVSFALAKKYDCDAVSTARGAILHDFFLYDWRTDRVAHHATGHPKTALRNAKARFVLNPIEEDIILKHMWPLTRGFFRYRESFIVSLVDKIVSAREVTNMDFSDLLGKLKAKRTGKGRAKSATP